jgi:hypothetical protein
MVGPQRKAAWLWAGRFQDSVVKLRIHPIKEFFEAATTNSHFLAASKLEISRPRRFL